jgi:hypothetical protein
MEFPEENPMAEAPKTSQAKKRVKVMGITFGVVLTVFAVLYLLTENESTAPFVYAIF